MTAIFVTAFALFLNCLFTGSSVADEPDSITIYQVGRTLEFRPEDITGVTYIAGKSGSSTGMEIEITEAMASKLEMFIEPLIGELIVIVFVGEISSDETLIGSVITGTRIFFGGPDTPQFQQLVQRLDDARRGSDQLQRLPIVSFERMNKITVGPNELVSCDIGNASVEIVFGQAFIQRLSESNTDFNNAKWFVSTDSQMIADWRQTSIDYKGLLTISGFDLSAQELKIAGICGGKIMVD